MMVIIKGNKNKNEKNGTPEEILMEENKGSGKNPLQISRDQNHVETLIEVFSASAHALQDFAMVKSLVDKDKDITAYNLIHPDFGGKMVRGDMHPRFMVLENLGLLKNTTPNRKYPVYKVTEKAIKLFPYIQPIRGSYNSNDNNLIPWTQEIEKYLGIDQFGTYKKGNLSRGTQNNLKELHPLYDTANDNIVYFMLNYNHPFVDFGGYIFKKNNFDNYKNNVLNHLAAGHTTLFEDLDTIYKETGSFIDEFVPSGYLPEKNAVRLTSKRNPEDVVVINLQVLYWFNKSYPDRDIRYYCKQTTDISPNSWRGNSNRIYEIVFRDQNRNVLGYHKCSETHYFGEDVVKKNV